MENTSHFLAVTYLNITFFIVLRGSVELISPMAGYVVEYNLGGRLFKAVITAVPLSKLKPHEEVRYRAVRTIARSIASSGLQKNPIIVDINSGVILDGMHRWHALRRVGARYAAVCLVEYSDPRIKLGRWVRYFPDADRIPSWLKGWLGKPQRLEEVESSPDAFIYFRGFARRISLPWDVLKAMRRVFKVEQRLSRELGKPSYLPGVSRDLEGLFLVPPRIAKKDVVRIASRGQVFPPKSTRHEIPVRPLHLNTPLTLLKSKEDWDVVSEALAALLNSKTLVEAPRGVVAEREYREAVLVFWGW